MFTFTRGRFHSCTTGPLRCYLYRLYDYEYKFNFILSAIPPKNCWNGRQILNLYLTVKVSFDGVFITRVDRKCPVKTVCSKKVDPIIFMSARKLCVCLRLSKLLSLKCVHFHPCGMPQSKHCRIHRIPQTPYSLGSRLEL